jgi:hypothetical protein
MDVEVSDFSILQILKTIYISPYVCEWEFLHTERIL